VWFVIEIIFGVTPTSCFLSQTSRSNFSEEAVSILKAWMSAPEHCYYPYPSDVVSVAANRIRFSPLRLLIFFALSRLQEKQQLAHEAQISKKQVCNWFSNTRKRQWQPTLVSNMVGTGHGGAAGAEVGVGVGGADTRAAAGARETSDSFNGAPADKNGMEWQMRRLMERQAPTNIVAHMQLMQSSQPGAWDCNPIKLKQFACTTQTSVASHPAVLTCVENTQEWKTRDAMHALLGLAATSCATSHAVYHAQDVGPLISTQQ
jgi:hypothetical protein